MFAVDDDDACRQRLRCNSTGVDDIFPGCLAEARERLSPAGVAAWIDGASAVCQLGRGQELPLIFLEAMPAVAAIAGEAIIAETVELTRALSRSGSARAIAPLLARLPACARRLETADQLLFYFDVVRQLAEQAPAGLPPFLDQADRLLGDLPIGGVRNWVDYGLRTYRSQPHRVADYFSLQTADARAALQRERRGTLLADHERPLRLTLKACWDLDDALLPYSLAFDLERRPRPHLDRLGFHLPDVQEDRGGVAGIDRYRAALAHLAAHRRWTRPLVADNFSASQRVLIETFEDARVESLAIRRFPGLRRLWLALHPSPREGDCPPGYSGLHHRAAILSRALLDPQNGYADPTLKEFVATFRERVRRDPDDRALATDLGIAYLLRIDHADFRSPNIFLRDTEVDYRDDNRFLWIFHEGNDDRDDFHAGHGAVNPRADATDPGAPAARHHPEWDYAAGTYRPDWATVYESQQAPGDPAAIDRIVARHDALAKRLKHLADLLKPQQEVRVRYREEGSELDLDVALRAMLDLRAGTTPDPRIQMSRQPAGRDVSVLVLVDLSQSINDVPAGGRQTILELAREAVSLLGFTLDALGDPFAIAGFASNTRHDVRYFHFKDFDETWGDSVKARVAGMEGALSTRMGTALRHAGHALAKRRSGRKLLLLLTDGEPADVDVDDEDYLRHDAHQAVGELAAHGVGTYCLSLDPGADDYVAGIFGAANYLVLDRVERLPERLPTLYLGLTR